jgi:hypothetical protein
MNGGAGQINLVFAWVWILCGFASGMVMGMKFRDEHWLGGYSSFKRRMYRLGHISFFGLGAVNLFFYLSVKEAPLNPPGEWASAAFIVGGLTMPVCCWLMARIPKAHYAFALPVVSLIAGAVLTLIQITL